MGLRQPLCLPVGGLDWAAEKAGLRAGLFILSPDSITHSPAPALHTCPGGEGRKQVWQEQRNGLSPLGYCSKEEGLMGYRWEGTDKLGLQEERRAFGCRDEERA